MPDFRIISESFKELSQLEEIFREIAQKTNNLIGKDIDEYGTSFNIINPSTGFDISFSIYTKEEFIDTFKFHDNLYGNIVQINWSSKMSHEDIDNFMMPLIKELREYLPDVLVESSDDFITLDEFIKREEEE
ncbi:hypothetical protein [Chryseobacterium sp. SL1]|uniref:hypothetical protein n=1 Tax=Chryseobacterium sp. SL1 TaxID=2995159 RepID=UPI002274D00C|nr:hypothetical protein [Chryseobacterium sp. SL1]MCY1659380.1 hypothetical protein [Chryseobacterium sp. SL1]